MRIITERPSDRADAFDRLAGFAQHLPGAARLQAALQRRSAARRWVWFLIIYIVSVVVFGAVALFLNALVPK